jgi:acyl-CoA synthetase (AMP-forming)/AMP-acid ligase II
MQRVESPLGTNGEKAARNISAVVLARAYANPESTAFIDWDRGTRSTYAELLSAIGGVAKALKAKSVGKGSIVAICGPNSPAFAAAVHGAWLAGATITTINPLSTPKEMALQFADAGVGLVLADPDAGENIVTAARAANIELVAFSSMSPTSQPASLEPAFGDRVAAILYSSGTTGLPKGAMLTHANLIAALHQLHDGDLCREGDIIAATAPFFHTVGLQAVLNLSLFVGAPIVTMRRFNFGEFIRAVSKERVTASFLTPPIMIELARNPLVETSDLSSLRLLFCAAAPLGPDIEQLVARRVGCLVKQGYGMTETAGPVSTNPNEAPLVKPGSVGPAAPETEIRIVDANGAELRPNEHGEVWVRGPQVMQGYLNQPEQTAQVITADGWLRTGDIGFTDADGFLFIVDRLKEVIKYKGYQIAPAELENVLLEHPAVGDAAVIGSPDLASGEVPKAFVVLKSAATPDEILDFVSARVAPYKKIRRLEVVSQIPKSASGKILRRVLVMQERERIASQVL